MSVLRLLMMCAVTLGFSIGCDREAGPSNSQPSAAGVKNDDVRLVQTVLAEQLKIKPESIDPHKTLAELGADDLDLVEAVMTIEDRQNITITDEALAKAAGTPDKVVAQLTVAKFASVVSAARRPR